MERRNFLGLASLLGLAPILPWNVFTEEQGTPGIVQAKTFDGEEVEFGEPVNLSDTFKIEVSDKITIFQKKHGEYNISGKGFVDDGTAVSWLIKVQPGRISTNGKLFINGKDGYVVESIYQEAPEMLDISSIDAGYYQCMSMGRQRTYLTCKKL